MKQRENATIHGLTPLRADPSQEEIEATALAAEKIQTWLEGKTIRKVTVVPGRLVNIAVS